MGQAGKSILIVDDDKSILYVFTLILQKKGYNVETAETCREAMKKAENQLFDLALIDAILPDVNGLELVSRLETMQPQMVKIIITGLPSEENAATALNNGASAFLTKPINPEILLNIIKEKLGNGKKELQKS